MIQRLVKKETADFSAITTWGVFYPEEGGPPNIILCDARRGRWDFPELKRIALRRISILGSRMCLD